MSRAVGLTADLFEQLQVDLDAMRTLAGIHAAQLAFIFEASRRDSNLLLFRFMTVAAELNLDSGEQASEVKS